MKKNREIPGILRNMTMLILILMLLSFSFSLTRVQGNSMFPAIEDGDRLLINKLSYIVGKPQRFDTVVFSYQYRRNTFYMKRIIGLPGETVRINDQGVIYVNGSVLIEHFGNAPVQNSGLAGSEITLGNDEYFVLGDNRNDSVDSRDPEVGNIKERDITGKAVLCLWPMKRFGVLQ